jgi:uncharacterized membrane protein HdeD (DUF308 family)
MNVTGFAEHLVHYWWLWAVRGLAAVLFGLTAFAWPGMTLAVLVWLFGAYALVSGVLTLATAVRHYGEYERGWLLFLEGGLSVAVGLITYFYPGITGLALLYMIAAWAIVTGSLGIAVAVQWHKVMEHAGLFALSGLASVFFGVVAVTNPGVGALSIVWLIGAYAVAFGVLLIAFAFRVRSWGSLTVGSKMHPV